MNKKYLASVLSIGALMSVLHIGVARAALVPGFFLASVGNGAQTQITVINADPNAPVTLYYPQGGTYSTLAIGTTDSTGRMTTTINPSTYNITSGGAGYVIVDGAQSQTQVWPSYSASSQTSSSATLTLSQTSVTLTVGQSVTIGASAGSGTLGAVSVQSNTNPSVAYTSVSGSNIIVNGSMVGSTALTVCASNSGCVAVYVTVQQTTASSNTTTQTNQAISFSPTSLSMKVGDVRTVALSGSGSYYISAHSRPGTVSNSISGSVLTLTGTSVGVDDMGLCSSGTNTVSCGTLSVTVTATDSNSNTSNGNDVTLVPNDLTLSIGQTRTVTVSSAGIASYYISGNTNTEAIGANLVGNTVTVMGNKVGGANVTVCQLGGKCASFYAYVPVSAGTVAPSAQATNVAGQPLALSSFSVSSNNVNNRFLGSGVALTVTFSVNQSVSSPTVSVGGSAVPVFGSGYGPYTAIYTMNGREETPLAIDISFGSSAAGTGSIRFIVGGSTAPVTASGSSGSSYTALNQVFTSYLHVGSTGPQVTALQTRLTALGIYSGPITGTFGAQTEAAVKKYQAKHKIDQLGAVGPATRSLLNQGL